MNFQMISNALKAFQIQAQFTEVKFSECNPAISDQDCIVTVNRIRTSFTPVTQFENK